MELEVQPELLCLACHPADHHRSGGRAGDADYADGSEPSLAPAIVNENLRFLRMVRLPLAVVPELRMF